MMLVTSILAVQAPEANIKAALLDKDAIDNGNVRLFEVRPAFRPRHMQLCYCQVVTLPSPTVCQCNGTILMKHYGYTQTEEELEAALEEERTHKVDTDKGDEAASSRDASDEHEEQRRAVV